MDPISIGIALAATAVGAIFNISGSQKASQAQQQIIAGEEQVQKTQQAQSNFIYERMKIEESRKAMQARGTAIASATDQGAGASSGIAGGLAGVTGQERFNLAGLNVNQGFANQAFALTYGIDQSKIQMAQGLSQAQLGQSIMGIGTTALNNLGPITSVMNQGYTGLNNMQLGSPFIGNLSGGQSAYS